MTRTVQSIVIGVVTGVITLVIYDHIKRN